jgi:hypothetical protein
MPWMSPLVAPVAAPRLLWQNNPDLLCARHVFK